MKPRKIIFECHVGSHLYGTNTEKSDLDFMGVFLPSTEDLFSMGNCPSEWSCDEKISNGDRNTSGDIDRKYYSVQKFLSLLAQGQPKQLEMLFAPPDKIIITSPEWEEIKKNETMFVAKKSISPFVGFATAQAYKSTLKGDNLNLVRNISDVVEKELFLQCRKTIDECVYIHEDGSANFLGIPINIEKVQYRPGVMMNMIVIAGRKFEFTSSLRLLLTKLTELERAYGTRSQAAAEVGIDFKSLMHCYRLLYETEQLLRTRQLSFPLPPEQTKFLLNIRAGKYEADYFQEIQDKLTEIKRIDSSLPDEVNYSNVNKLCIKLLREYHMRKNETTRHD